MVFLLLSDETVFHKPDLSLDPLGQDVQDFQD
jgi:hypothetical protein